MLRETPVALQIASLSATQVEARSKNKNKIEAKKQHETSIPSHPR
jgi:hypothetical protein